MSEPLRFPVPPRFRFGASSAAYQIEGAVAEDGRGESIWDRFCRVPGAVAQGETGDVACGAPPGWACQPVVPRPVAARRLPERPGRAVRAARRALRASPWGHGDDRDADRLRRHQLLPPGLGARRSRARAARARARPPPPPTSPLGWQIDPHGLREVLSRLVRDYGPRPIWITENGIPDAAETPGRHGLEDQSRIDYLCAHLEALGAALADGADIRRYFVWSLLDSFEWELGYGARFGLVHVDFETQRRALKRSARW